jgi:hypothetical protein
MGLILIPAGALGSAFLGYALAWSPYATGADMAPEQPIPFSHQHHVGGLGIDCRYCHANVERSPFADLPPSQTCMSCHSQIWTRADALAPLRESFVRGKPVAWTRVYDLPDYVYFDHSIHVAKGVACVVCHGRLDRMPAVYKQESLYMKWCLDCHRDPAPNLRPRENVFDMEWTPAMGGGAAPGSGARQDPAALGRELMRRYHVRTSGLTDCTVCHR